MNQPNMHRIEYSNWDKRSTISDLSKKLGLVEISEKSMDFSTSMEIIDNFLTIIKREAKVGRRYDVLEQLHFAGLITA